MLRIFLITVFSSLVFACSTTQTGRGLDNWPDSQLLTSVWDQKSDQIDEEVAAEIARRGIIPETEWALIRQRDVEDGMSENGLFASLGTPTRTSPISTWDGIQNDYDFIRSNVRYKVSVKKGVVVSHRRY
jgi:hypothetical protein